MYRLQQIISLLQHKEDKKQSMDSLLSRSQQIIDQLNVFIESEEDLLESAHQALLENERKIDSVNADKDRAKKREEDLNKSSNYRSEFTLAAVKKEQTLSDKRLERFNQDKLLLNIENLYLQTQLDMQKRQKASFENNLALIKQEVQKQTALINTQNQSKTSKYEEELALLKSIDPRLFELFTTTIHSKKPVAIAGIDGDFGDYTCGNCHIYITHSIGDIIQNTKLHNCKECGSYLAFLAHIVSQPVPHTEDEFTYHCSQCQQELDQEFVETEVSHDITDCICPNCERQLINL